MQRCVDEQFDPMFRQSITNLTGAVEMQIGGMQKTEGPRHSCLLARHFQCSETITARLGSLVEGGNFSYPDFQELLDSLAAWRCCIRPSAVVRRPQTARRRPWRLLRRFRG